MQAGLVAIFTYALRCVGPADSGVFVVSVSALIVLLVGLTGVSPAQVIPARAINTAVGGLLALLAYWIWPTWEKEADQRSVRAHAAFTGPTSAVSAQPISRPAARPNRASTLFASTPGWHAPM